MHASQVQIQQTAQERPPQTKTPSWARGKKSAGDELAEGDGEFSAAMAALTAEATAATKAGSRACWDVACETELDDTISPVDDGEQLVPEAIEASENKPADKLLYVERDAPEDIDNEQRKRLAKKGAMKP